MTIRDVAKVAGVSKSTVSRYLNDGYVSIENKEKIKRAIEETGYKTNVFARGLKTNKSHLIAIIVPRLNSFTATLTLTGMNEILVRYGYQMVVVPKNTIEEDEIIYLKKIASQGFDGVIVMAHAITEDHVNLSKSSLVPILFTGQNHDEVHSMTLDDYKIGSDMAQYVNSLKPKRVLYLSVSESDYSVGVNRKMGLIDHLEAPVRTLVTGFTHEEAYAVMKQESATIDYDLVVGATDNIAMGALRYIKESGKNVPDDIKVVGIGNYEVGTYLSPTLTTLDIDYKGFGNNAALYMLDLLKEEIATDEKKAIEYTLIERETSQS